jgi:phage gpG-like protein
MAGGIAEDIALEDLPQWLARATSAVAAVNCEPLLKQCKVGLAKETKKNFDAGVGPNGEVWAPLRFREGKPLRDKGLLMGSVFGQGAGHIEELTATSLIWGSNLQYAAVHQFGGTITPKNGKALAIPMTPEAKRSGGPRNFGKPLALVWPKNSDHGWLVEQSGKRKVRTNLHFLLVAKVTIPARPFIGWNDRLINLMGNLTGDFFEKKIGGIPG